VKLYLCGTAAANGPFVHPAFDRLYELIWSSGGMILTGKAGELVEKLVPVLLCPPEI
jgi:hypothetical protein